MVGDGLGRRSAAPPAYGELVTDRQEARARALRTCGAALRTFAKVEGVEPTNNAAERAVPKGVLWRKAAFGSHSAEGSRFAERMLTVSESLRAQGRSILGFVEHAIRVRLTGQPSPSLLPPPRRQSAPEWICHVGGEASSHE